MRQERARTWVRMVSALAGVLLAVAPAAAQTIRGTITGTVTDSTGAAVPGITVTVTNPATGIGSSAQTNRDGTYTIPLLASGTYQAVGRAVGVQEVPPRRDRGPDRADDAPRHRAPGRQHERGGRSGGGGAARAQHDRGARPGHRDEADPGPAPQRPLLPAPHHHDAGSDAVLRPRRLRGERLLRGREDRDRSYRERHAVVGQQLPPGRRGQQRDAERVHQYHPAPRSHPGIQGPDQQPHRGVRRVRRGGREPHPALGHERDPRLRLQLHAGRRAEQPVVFRPDQGALPVEPVRGHAGRPHHEEQGLLLRGLPGAAPGPGPHQHHDRPHPVDAAGQLQRGPRRRLRPRHAPALRREHHPHEPDQPHQPGHRERHLPGAEPARPGQQPRSTTSCSPRP